MADRPSDSPRPGSAGPPGPAGDHPSGGHRPTAGSGAGSSQGASHQPARPIAKPAHPGRSTDTPIGDAAPSASMHASGISTAGIASLVAMLDHEPAVGLAIVDSRCRAIHANRRFVALTQLPPDTSSAAGAPAGADRRKGVWARIGPEAVHTDAAERRPAVVHFIHEGVQVQCDVWPLPSGSGASGGSGGGSTEPMFLVLAVEGRQDPNDAAADEGAPGVSAGGVIEANAAKTAQRFITLAPMLAELGALNALTARELEVLALIGQGMATREIAESLGRSPRTIERHCDAIHKKLGTTNRVQMARYAMQAGLTAEAGKLKRV